MKENTIKKLRRTIKTYRHDSTSPITMHEIIAEAVLSLARRVRKLERAAEAQETEPQSAFEYPPQIFEWLRGEIARTKEATPERKVKQEQYPRLQAGFNYMSEDVMITVINTPQFVGYYNYRDRQWMIYTAEDASVPFNRTVKSWQYLPDSQPQPANQWISVSERLPEREESYSGSASIDVLIYGASLPSALDCDDRYISVGFYVYARGWWEAHSHGRIDNGIVTHWQPLPSAPHD